MFLVELGLRAAFAHLASVYFCCPAFNSSSLSLFAFFCLHFGASLGRVLSHFPHFQPLCDHTRATIPCDRTRVLRGRTLCAIVTLQESIRH
jgi:hypothetical protein